MLSKEVFLSLIMILPLIQRSIIGDFLSRNTSRIVDEKSSKDVLTRAEFERNLCEEELYRLRFGIENILSNIEEFDKSILTSKSFSAATKKKMNFSTNFPGGSWFERCSFCCRRWRRKTSNDELVDNSLKEKLRDLIPTSKNSKEENRFHSSSENQRLLMKILEVKALDCLCSDYSKRRAHKELRRALSHVERSPSRSRKSSKTSSRRKGSTSRSKSNVKIIRDHGSSSRSSRSRKQQRHRSRSKRRVASKDRLTATPRSRHRSRSKGKDHRNRKSRSKSRHRSQSKGNDHRNRKSRHVKQEKLI